MNDPALFLAGVGVTLLVVSALALLVWGAILDGREEARQRARARTRQSRTETNARPLNDRVPLDAA